MDYKKVVKDFKNGIINRDVWAIEYDSATDEAWWIYTGDYDLDEKEMDALYQDMDDTYGDPEGTDGIVEVLQALGVNAEWV